MISCDSEGRQRRGGRYVSEWDHRPGPAWKVDVVDRDLGRALVVVAAERVAERAQFVDVFLQLRQPTDHLAVLLRQRRQLHTPRTNNTRK